MKIQALLITERVLGAGHKDTIFRLVMQRSIRPDTQSIAFDIVSRCFEIKTIIVEKQNFAKMPFVYYLQIDNLVTARTFKPQSSQKGIT